MANHLRANSTACSLWGVAPFCPERRARLEGGRRGRLDGFRCRGGFISRAAGKASHRKHDSCHTQRAANRTRFMANSLLIATARMRPILHGRATTRHGQKFPAADFRQYNNRGLSRKFFLNPCARRRMCDNSTGADRDCSAARHGQLSDRLLIEPLHPIPRETISWPSL